MSWPLQQPQPTHPPPHTGCATSHTDVSAGASNNPNDGTIANDGGGVVYTPMFNFGN